MFHRKDPIARYQHLRGIRWSQRTQAQWVLLLSAAEEALAYLRGMSDGYQKSATDLLDETIALRAGFDLAIEQRNEAEQQVEDADAELKELRWKLHFALTHNMAELNLFTEEDCIRYIEKLYNKSVVKFVEPV